MSITRQRPRLKIPSHGHKKEIDEPPYLGHLNLSPDLQPHAPSFPCEKDGKNAIFKIGKYFLLEQIEGEVYKAVNIHTKDECICKIFSLKNYKKDLQPYWQADCHPNIGSIQEIILGSSKAYVFFARHYGDLHSYVRQKKRLREEEARPLFRQILQAVTHCHHNGIVLRDLKLRKFVFKNQERTEIRLDGLEDAFVLEDEADDSMSDKHGCPAYVSPEILQSQETYQGRPSDIWSLGVMLYTVLIGRYPFHDSDPTALFTKIRRGQYSIPSQLTPKAKCLIRSLLRLEPCERLAAGEVLQHPWVQNNSSSVSFMTVVDHKNCDQTVPNVVFHTQEDSLFS